MRSWMRFWLASSFYQAIAMVVGLSFASLLRFCAVAASKNSSLAPHGPRSRSRPSRKMRLGCAITSPPSFDAGTLYHTPTSKGPCHVAGIFMQVTWDLPSWRIGTALHLELASVTVLFAGTIKIKARALRCDARSWFCIRSMELDQFLPAGQVYRSRSGSNMKSAREKCRQYGWICGMCGVICFCLTNQARFSAEPYALSAVR